MRAFLIDTLNSDEFEEHEVEQSPVLRGSGVGWNARGMHHLDPVQIGPGEWLAAVDGFKTLYGFRR